MQTMTTIGLDIAKSVFQVHGVDAGGQVIVRRQLKRRYVLTFFQKLSPCLVGIEACGSAHHWSRELQALGHNVRLIPPAYVKPYVKRQKNDAADAEAICEAVTRANMRFVPTKTPEQQSGLVLHRARHLFIRQQTAVINAIRAHLAEFGIVAPVGRHGVEELLNVFADPNDKRVPEIARACLSAFVAPTKKRAISPGHQLREEQHDGVGNQSPDEPAGLSQDRGRGHRGGVEPAPAGGRCREDHHDAARKLVHQALRRIRRRTTLAPAYEKETGVKVVYELTSVGSLPTRISTIAETGSGADITMMACCSRSCSPTNISTSATSPTRSARSRAAGTTPARKPSSSTANGRRSRSAISAS